MYFPKFWAKGSYNHQNCWHWSDISVGAAQDLANKHAQKLSTLFTGATRPPQNQYWYANRPLREQVLEEIKNQKGEVSALITRNRYGTKVLNTEQILFVDIDVEEPKSEGGLKNLFGSLFGKKPVESALSPDDKVISQAKSWRSLSRSSGWRIYKTRAGYRLIATHELTSPESDLTTRAFQHFGADPLYQKLCKAQRSFRARLSPKPWRCGMDTPVETWPFPDAKQEAMFLDWERAYDQRRQPFATCKYLQSVGSSEVHPEIAPIISLHDELCRVGEELPLA